MNVEIDFFNKLIQESSNIDNLLSVSLNDIDDVIYRDLDSRVSNVSINEDLYDIKADIKKLKDNTSDIKSQNQYSYNIWMDNINEIPTEINMLTDKDGVPWILKNYKSIEKNKLNNTNILFQNLKPELQTRIRELEIKFSFLKDLKPEEKNAFYEEVALMMWYESLYIDYEKKRNEILKDLEYLNNEKNKIKDNIEFSIAILNPFLYTREGQYEEEKNMLETFTEKEFIDYYLTNKMDDDFNGMSDPYELDFNIQPYLIGKDYYELESKKNEILSKHSEYESIEQMEEIETKYQMYNGIKDAFAYNYIEKTTTYKEFMNNVDSHGALSLNNKGYDYNLLTPEEKERYDFLYINYGTKESDDYYNIVLEQQLIMRKGYKEGYDLLSKLKDKVFLSQWIITEWEGIQDGFEQSIEGFKNILFPSGKPTSDSYKMQVVVAALENEIIDTYFDSEEAKEIKDKLLTGEYTQNDVINALKKNGKNYNEILDSYFTASGLDNVKNMILSKLYTGSVSIGNMAPSIALSIITGNPVIGSIAMGLSSMGNAQNDALMNGASRLSAFIYGSLIGSSEATLGYFLGKTPFLSKSSVNLFKTAGLVATLKGMVSNASGELVEEGAQFIFDNLIFRPLLLGQPIDIEDLIGGTAESASMGFFVSLLMGSGQVAIRIGTDIVNLSAEQIKTAYEAYSIKDPVLRMERLEEISGPLGISFNLFGEKNNNYSQQVDSELIFSEIGLPKDKKSRLSILLKNTFQSALLKLQRVINNSEVHSDLHSGESIENTIYKKLDNVLILEDGPIKSKEINSIINNILSIEDPNIRISILNNVFNNDKQYSIIEYKLIASIYALEDTNLKKSILDSFNNNVIDISNYYGAGAIYILLNIGKQFGDINLENVDFSNPNNDLSKLGINALELLSWANENNNKLIIKYANIGDLKDLLFSGSIDFDAYEEYYKEKFNAMPTNEIVSILSYNGDNPKIKKMIDVLIKSCYPDLHYYFPDYTIPGRATITSKSQNVSVFELLSIVTNLDSFIAFLNGSLKLNNQNQYIYLNALKNLLNFIKYDNNSIRLNEYEIKRIEFLVRNYDEDLNDMEYLVHQARLELENRGVNQIVIDGLIISKPKNFNFNYQNIRIKDLIKIIKIMPPELANSIKGIKLFDVENPDDYYWKIAYSINHVSVACGGDGYIYIYSPASSEWNSSYLSDTMYHEAAHNFDNQKKWRKYSESKEWIEAIALDKTAPTEYAKTNNVEDFAESVVLYYSDRDNFIKNFPHRAAILMKIFK